ncbi:hypothetical protein [Methanosarcina horonobensis]|nr:hypothetical protein [Methanosarcina horonobensis]
MRLNLFGSAEDLFLLLEASGSGRAGQQDRNTVNISQFAEE